MVRQALDLRGYPVSRKGFEGPDNARVQHPPPLQEETVVGHLVRQGVLKGEVALGEEPRLVEELRRLQVGEAAIEVRLGPLGNGLQQG